MSKESMIKELRATLSATTNTGGVAPGYNAVEINAVIDKFIVDASPKFSELRSMIPRESISQGSYIWNVRTSDNSSKLWAYSFSEATLASGTNTNTPAQGAKKQLHAEPKSLRVDWEVEGLFLAASSSYYNAVADEIENAVKTFIDVEEKQIVGGNDSGAYGDANGFLGLKQIVNSYVTIGDTTTIYGIARASGKTYLDAQVVNAAGAALKLSHLDAMITAQRKTQAMPGMFVVSYERADEINQLLQAQQRFTGTMNTPAGFTVATYQGIPILKSRYMDKTGASDTDTAMFLIAADNLKMKVLREVANRETDLGRYDAVGGYVSAYEVLVSPRLISNVVLHNVAVPA